MTDGRSGWSELAARYDRTRTIPCDGERVATAAVAARLRSLGARRVLDLGCGTGRFALPLARDGFRVVAADRSPEMLARLAEKRRDERLAVVRCDADALPFRRAFDVVLFSHFLHLVSSLDVLARELSRTLLPGAHVVLVDSGAGARPATIRVLSHVLPRVLSRKPFVPDPTGDDSRDRRLLRDLLARLHGEEVDVAPVGTFPLTVSLREALEDVRARTWWTFRALDEATCVRAAADAERALLAEGADLDARVDESVVVRLIVGRVG